MRTLTVVVIHREDAIRELICGELERSYIHAVPARDGYEGIVKIGTHGPDAVVVNSHLPDPNRTHDGFKVAEYVRGHRGIQHLPVLLLTTEHLDPRIVHRALEERVTGIYPEPFHSNADLVRTVQSLLPNTAPIGA